MSVALSLALAVAILSLSGGALRLWSTDGMVLFPSGTYGLVCGGVIALGALAVSWLRCKRQGITFSIPPLASWANPWVWGSAVAALFFSHWLCRPYSFLQGPLIRGEMLLFFGITFLSMRILSHSLWRGFALLASLLLAWSFFEASGGKLLFMDDHAMFLFRFKLLREHFPSIPFWSPVWNGGIDARDFFATGALNTFILAAPLFYLLGVDQSYNTVVALVLFALVPAASYTAGRLLHAGPRTSSIAAVLAMCSSLLWYRWALKYGTMGFLVSTALLPLTVALSIRFITSTTITYREMALLIASTSLMILWSLSGIALIPLAILAIPRLPTIVRSRRHLLTLAVLVALNVPWMAMMWKVSNVSRFISTSSQGVAAHSSTDSDSGQPSDEKVSEQPSPQQQSSVAPAYRHRAGSLDPRESLRRWQESAVSLNPLVIVLALPALFSLTGIIRISYLLVVGWLFTLGTFGVSLKPQLELDRMLVMGAVLLSVPIGAMIASMIETAASSLTRRLVTATVLSFLCTSPFAAATVLFNRSADRYYFATSAVEELTSKIRDNSSGGRTLFTGCVLHQLSNGHLAPLALWSQTPLIASSYAHNIWKYEQPIPESFLDRKDDGIRDYLNAMNVTTILAHEPVWRKYFRSRPAEYAEVGRVDSFIFFKRLSAVPSYTLEGSISNLSQRSNTIAFTAESSEITLKFNYFPFLRSSKCSLAPRPISPEITFIKLTNCPVGEEVTIESVSPIERLLLRSAPPNGNPPAHLPAIKES